jgi:hypothetical protein
MFQSRLVQLGALFCLVFAARWICDDACAAVGRSEPLHYHPPSGPRGGGDIGEYGFLIVLAVFVLMGSFVLLVQTKIGAGIIATAIIGGVLWYISGEYFFYLIGLGLAALILGLAVSLWRERSIPEERVMVHCPKALPCHVPAGNRVVFRCPACDGLFSAKTGEKIG